MKEKLLALFSNADLEEQIQQKQRRFSGLLTEEAALRLIAQEHGVPFPSIEAVPTPLALLSEGLATIKVRVWSIFAPKTFERKDGHKGRVCNVRIADDSGQATLVLWGPDVSALRRIARNDVLLVKDAYVKSLSPLEIHSRLSSELLIRPDDSTLPKNPVPLFNLVQAVGEEFDIVGRVVEKGDLKEFERDGRKGAVFRLVLADLTARKTLVAWDDNAFIAEKTGIGDGLKVEGAYEKNGELHVSWRGRMISNPSCALPPLEALFPKKALSDLNASDALVEASVDAVFEAQHYFKCQCGQKGEKPECACGAQAKEVSFVSLRLKDSSSTKRTVLFGEAARDFLGVEGGVPWPTFLQLKREYLVGKAVRLIARAKKNDFSGEAEVVGKHVVY